MTLNYQRLLRALIAAQVAVYEHADEDISVQPSKAKKALFECLKEVGRLARKLE